MLYLIDGYNFMNHAPIVSSGVRVTATRTIGELESARDALCDFLAVNLWDAERRRTTVVYDASNAPPGLPRRVVQNGITLYFASQFPDADTMIEQLISEHSSPRHLTVISSDHRLHRAARRRRATPIDSEVWYRQLVRRRRELLEMQGALGGTVTIEAIAPDAARPLQTPKPKTPLADNETLAWLRYFGLDQGEAGSDVVASVRQEPPLPRAQNPESGPVAATDPEKPGKRRGGKQTTSRHSGSGAKRQSAKIRKKPTVKLPFDPPVSVSSKIQPLDSLPVDQIFPAEYLQDVERLLREMFDEEL